MPFAWRYRGLLELAEGEPHASPARIAGFRDGTSGRGSLKASGGWKLPHGSRAQQAARRQSTPPRTNGHWAERAMPFAWRYRGLLELAEGEPHASPARIAGFRDGTSGRGSLKASYSACAATPSGVAVVARLQRAGTRSVGLSPSDTRWAHMWLAVGERGLEAPARQPCPTGSASPVHSSPNQRAWDRTRRLGRKPRLA
jgi:hypothetical protein